MTEVRLVPTTDAVLWDRLVRTLPRHTQFHTWDWLELVRELFDARIDHLVVHHAGIAVGVVPVVRLHQSRMNAHGLPFPYLGPLVPDALLAGTVRAYRAWQLRNGVGFAVIELPPGVDGAASLRAGGAAAYPTSTVVVDLPSEEAELGDRYSTMRRRSLRRAERAGAAVRPSLAGEVEQLLDGVLEQAYEAHGIPSPYPPGTGAVVERWMTGRDDVLALTATVHGEPAGVHIVLTGGPTALSWVVASDRRFREIGPNALLYHEALAESVRRGFGQMDLVGRVDDGVFRFKTSFGGREVEYVAGDSFIGPPVLRRTLKMMKQLRRSLRSGTPARSSEA